MNRPATCNKLWIMCSRSCASLLPWRVSRAGAHTVHTRMDMRHARERARDGGGERRAPACLPASLGFRTTTTPHHHPANPPRDDARRRSRLPNNKPALYMTVQEQSKCTKASHPPPDLKSSVRARAFVRACVLVRNAGALCEGSRAPAGASVEV